MSNHQQDEFRILAIALSTRGFGFVVMEGKKTLIAWGAKGAEGDKNTKCLAKVEKLLELYRPDILVLQDVEAKGSRRAPRIRELNRELIEAAGKRKIKVALFSAVQLRSMLLGDAEGTKHEMAEILAARFPEELSSRMPRKRSLWKSEDGRMDIFDAAALAVAFWMRKVRS